jgi:hypothetical protein
MPQFPVMPPGMESQNYPPDPNQGMDSQMDMSGQGYDAQSLSDIARPSHEDEDIQILSGIKMLTDMTKALISKSKSGLVDDTLTAILSKLNSLQKAYDRSIEEASKGNV